MGLIEFSLKRRVTVSMMAVALIVFGMVAFTRLPINLLPDISYPTLTVETRFPGAAPGEVESLVSRPVEEAVGVVAGQGGLKDGSPIKIIPTTEASDLHLPSDRPSHG